MRKPRSHLWMVEVLNDMMEYSTLNGLTRSYDALTSAYSTIVVEVTDNSERVTVPQVNPTIRAKAFR